jgi:hypothetical protein
MAAVGIALIGVFGALVGVIATEGARKHRDEAAAAAQLRAAARMVSAEMGLGLGAGSKVPREDAGAVHGAWADLG